jgi:hypothetical protein
MLVSRKPALTPTLSPEEREKWLPGLGKMIAPDWFMVHGPNVHPILEVGALHETEERNASPYE